MDFEFNERLYRFGNLSAFEQLHVARRLGPLVHGGLFFLGPAYDSFKAYESGDAEAADKAFVQAAYSSKPFLDALASMPENDLNYVVSTVLGRTKRKVAGEWMRVYENNTLRFDDMDMVEILRLVVEVLNQQLRPIFASYGLVAIAEGVRAKVLEDGEASRKEKTS